MSEADSERGAVVETLEAMVGGLGSHQIELTQERHRTRYYLQNNMEGVKSILNEFLKEILLGKFSNYTFLAQVVGKLSANFETNITNNFHRFGNQRDR